MLTMNPMLSPTFRRLFGRYDPSHHEGLLRECEDAYDNPDALRRSNIPEDRIQALMDVVRDLRQVTP